MKSVIPLLILSASCVVVAQPIPVPGADQSTTARDLCVEPARGPINSPNAEQSASRPLANTSTPIAQVGRPAPDFEAHAYTNGGFRPIRLSDYIGKWVVICFYPGDFTFVCPTELAAVAVRYDELTTLGVEVLSFSTDSRFSHKVWNETELSKMVEGGLPFPMLTDPSGRIGRVYGVYDEEASVDNRGRFIVDPDGVVQAIEILTPSVGRNVDELIRQLKSFQYVRATGEVTPSGWTPGAPTLRPLPELAGKVWTQWKPATPAADTGK